MDRQKLRPNSYDRFRDSLAGRDYKSYDDYLMSEAWKHFNQWYRSHPAMLKECMVCCKKSYILHHWRYDRCGAEYLSDVIPLCEDHHHELHRYLHKTKHPLSDVLGQLVECFGMSKDAARKKLKIVERYIIREEQAGQKRRPLRPHQSPRGKVEAAIPKRGRNPKTIKKPSPFRELRSAPKDSCRDCNKKLRPAFLVAGRCYNCRKRKQEQLVAACRRQSLIEVMRKYGTSEVSSPLV
jgi:hypothetical protein